MKKCKHCGAEYEDETVDKCTNCGSRVFEKVRPKAWRGMTGLQRFSILFLLLAVVYLISPWDILPFSFFDDLAIIAIAIGIWIIVVVMGGGENKQ